MNTNEHYAGSCPPGQHCCLCAEDALKNVIVRLTHELARKRELLKQAVWEADAFGRVSLGWVGDARRSIEATKPTLGDPPKDTPDGA